MSMFGTQTQKLGTVLMEIIKAHGLDKKMSEALLPKVWAETVGERAAAITKIKKFSEGKLTVEVSSSVWRTELALRSQEIREKMNKTIGENLVKKIILK